MSPATGRPVRPRARRGATHAWIMARVSGQECSTAREGVALTSSSQGRSEASTRKSRPGGSGVGGQRGGRSGEFWRVHSAHDPVQRMACASAAWHLPPPPSLPPRKMQDLHTADRPAPTQQFEAAVGRQCSLCRRLAHAAQRCRHGAGGAARHACCQAPIRLRPQVRLQARQRPHLAVHVGSVVGHVGGGHLRVQRTRQVAYLNACAVGAPPPPGRLGRRAGVRMRTWAPSPPPGSLWVPAGTAQVPGS